jgi:hypothetical protein
VPSRRRVLAVAVAGGCVLAGATTAAVGMAKASSARAVASGPQRTPGQGFRSLEPRADRGLRAIPAVAPLRRLTPPDVLVSFSHAASPRRVARIRHMAGVAGVAVLDRGNVRLGSRTVDVIGVDPGVVRAFTPKFTAVSTALWRSVARGELTLSYSRAAGMRRQLGAIMPIVHRQTVQPLRIGAFASIGLGHAQGMVDHATARHLGLPRSRAVLVSASDLSVDTIRADVSTVFGPRARVHVLRPHTVDQAVISSYARATIPASYLKLYRAAATSCRGLPWTVLAAIGAVETGHGADTRTSSKGAMGPMQFLPSTFVAYAVDGDGDGVANIQDPADAVYSAARYLCLWGAGRGGQSLYDAIWAYNHADWYVREVLQLAVAYS